jgi:hypothetical protein
MNGTPDDGLQIPQSFRLDGLNAYVTGGGRGIGKACALGLAEAPGKASIPCGLLSR